MALASGAVAFALSPLIGRGASAGIAGAILVAGYFINGYQAAVPAFGGVANLTWWGWTAHHQPLAGEYDWVSLVPAAIVAIVLFVVGVELFARRDLGLTSRVPWPGIPAALIGLRGPTSRSLGERLPLAVSWGIGIGLMGFIFGAASLSLTDAVSNLSPETQQIYRNLFPNLELNGAGAFLQLAFMTFGLILVGFATATLVNGWATDETGGRLETLLSTPMSRVRWALSSGLGVYLAIALMTAVIALGIGIGAALAGFDVVTPVTGTVVLGLYALALAGIGLAVGGIISTGVRRRGHRGDRDPDVRHRPARPGAQVAGLGAPDRADVAPGPADDRQLGLGRHGCLRRDRGRRAAAGRLGLLEARHRALAAAAGAAARGPAAPAIASDRGPDRARLRRAGRGPPRRRGTSCSRRADDPLRTAAVGVAAASAVHRPDRAHRLVRPRPAVDPAAGLGDRHPVGRRRGPVLRVPRGRVPARRPVGRLPARPRQRPAARHRDRHHGSSASGCRPARGWASGCSSPACCWSSGRGVCSGPRPSANDRAAAGFALLTGATIAIYSALDTRRACR